MSLDDVAIVKAVHPPAGTELTSLFAEDNAAWARTGETPSPYASDFEFSVPAIGGAEGRTTGRGLPALFEVWRDWLQPWERYWTEIEDFLDAGDGRVVVLLRDHGRLKGGDTELVQRAASVWTVGGDKIARIDFYLAWSEALEAAGLAE